MNSQKAELSGKMVWGLSSFAKNKKQKMCEEI